MANLSTRKPLTGVIFLSACIHVGLIAAVGGFVVFRYLKRPPVQFKAPPPPAVQRLEPRKLEYKVRMQENQKKSGRPTVSPRLTAQSIGSISLPEIKTDSLKPTPNKILSNLSSFGTSGLGDGLGGGTGTGGLGLGMSGVTFFGIPDRGERIAFLLDASLSMLEDERGGIPGYTAVKNEIVKMVRNLSEGTFFNVYAFEKGVDTFNPKMMLAKPETKDDFEKWVAPYNCDPKNLRNGTLRNNYEPGELALPATIGTTRMDMAITAAFEQQADVIFILTDGTPRIWRPLTEAEQKRNAKILEDWEKSNDPEKIRKINEKIAADFEKMIQKENEKRAKKGLPPKIIEGGRGPGMGIPGLVSPMYNQEDILEHINKLGKELYEKNKRKPPRIHVVGYMTTPTDEQFLKTLARENQGRFKRIKPLVKPIVVD